MGGVPNRQYFQKIIDSSPEITIGKRYDFKCIKDGDKCYIYRRLFEGEPWEKAYRVFLDEEGKILYTIILDMNGLTFHPETKTAKIGARREF